MLFLLLVVLGFLVFWDARLLRKQDDAGYKQIMHYSELQWMLWHVVLGVAVLPVYLLRRAKFRKPQTLSEPLVIASDACGVLLQWIMGMVVWVIFIEGFTLFFPAFEKSIEELIVSAVFSSAWMVCLIYWATQRYAEGFFKFVALKRNGAPLWKFIFVPVLVGIGFSVIASMIIWERPVQPSTPLSEIIDSTTSVPWMMIFIAMAVLVAPLLEEITFRGYLYKVLLSTRGKTFTIFFISFLFAILHVNQYWGDWPAIGIVAVLGFMLTLLRAWSGSTVASAITHYIYNAGVTFIPIMLLVFSNPAYMEYRMKFDELDNTGKAALLQKSIEADPALEEAYNDLAWVYAEEGKNLEEALSLVEKALESSPENAAFLDTKAEVLFKLGRIEEAIAIEEEIVTDSAFIKTHTQEQLQKFRAAQSKE